jgi:hypothetical protein
MCFILQHSRARNGQNRNIKPVEQQGLGDFAPDEGLNYA